MLHFEINVALFSVEEARLNLFDVDPQTQRATALLEEAARLLERSRRSSLVAAR